MAMAPLRAALDSPHVAQIRRPSWKRSRRCSSPVAWQFSGPGKIAFGRGEAEAQLPQQTMSMGKSALVVTGKSTGERVGKILDSMESAGAHLKQHALPGGEPTVQDAEACVKDGVEFGADVVVGIGGGSAVDVGKAASALMAQPEGTYTYLEVVGEGRPLDNRPLPFIAVPTTAGTGSEATRNAVVEAPDDRRKVSIRHNTMFPSLSIVDPELTQSVPQATTASTGLDALIQCLEPFISKNAQPMTDGLAREGMARGSRSLLRAFRDGSDLDAREDMCVCSLHSGLALANAGLGAVHGFAGPLGGVLDHAPHGAVCASLLAASLEVNVRGAKRREGESTPLLARVAEAARIVTGKEGAGAEDLVTWSKEVSAELNTPPLRAYGMDSSLVSQVVEMGKTSSSMKGNPVPLDDEELTEILERSI